MGLVLLLRQPLGNIRAIGPVMICGTRIKIQIIPTVRNSHGITDFITFSSESPVTFSAAYRHTPTGGVIRPKLRVMTRNTTKNRGLTPSYFTTGSRMGTRM